MADEDEELTGVKKSAVLLVLMGHDRAGKVLKHLNDEDVEQLTLEVANLGEISDEKKQKVYDEFFKYAQVKEYINKGGVDYAKKLLEGAFGPDRAMQIIEKLVSNLQVKPFDFLKKVDVNQMVNVLQNEHPQTVALVLCYLPTDVSSQVIQQLPEALQVDVVKRISVMSSATPDVVKQIENQMKERLSKYTSQKFSQVGGIETAAEMMNNVERGVAKNIFDKLSERDPKLSEEIRQKMFVFEDVVKLDNRSIQRILRDIETNDLTMALKGASDEVQDAIFSNLSKRQSQIIKEELDFMGPVRVADVDEAQQKVVNVIRKLEESGEIIIGGGGGEELIE